jgi:quercetin dioxygenase-like cupin family protein
MKRTRLDDTPATDAGTTQFTGTVRRHDLIAVDDPPGTALLVRFEPMARTHWHAHPEGQYLYVVEGRGLTQSRGGEVVELRPGDCVYAAPGEEHWHGAAPDQGMAHFAVSLGVTEWAEPVEGDGR